MGSILFKTRPMREVWLDHNSQFYRAFKMEQVGGPAVQTWPRRTFEFQLGSLTVEGTRGPVAWPPQETLATPYGLE